MAGGGGVISPFKAPLGISVKVEIPATPRGPTGCIILAGVARSRRSFLVVVLPRADPGTRKWDTLLLNAEQ